MRKHITDNDLEALLSGNRVKETISRGFEQELKARVNGWILQSAGINQTDRFIKFSVNLFVIALLAVSLTWGGLLYAYSQKEFTQETKDKMVKALCRMVLSPFSPAGYKTCINTISEEVCCPGTDCGCCRLKK